MSLVVLVEGETEPIVLNALIGKLDIPRDRVKIIVHQGVDSLEKSLPRKLRGWTDRTAKFLVMRDNDNGDCRARKAKLEKIAADAGKTDQTVVRIVCQEIEAWFLGDPMALEAAGLLKKGARPKLLKRDPDTVIKPSKELERLVRRYSKHKSYQKKSGASKIAKHLTIEENRSISFKHTVASLVQLTNNGGE
jgi:predicted ATP-dependent endonuclease of OLD family